MNDHTLLIVTGRDRPGIVSAVSRLLAGSGANLEDVRMSILEGQFAMMLIVRLPASKKRAALARGLKKLQTAWRLVIFQCPLGRLSVPAAGQRLVKNEKTLVLRVLGRDKTGIVAGISRILAARHFNITDLQCRILGAGAKAFYTMILECTAPSPKSVSALPSTMRKLGKKLGVEIQIQTADLVQL